MSDAMTTYIALLWETGRLKNEGAISRDDLNKRIDELAHLWVDFTQEERDAVRAHLGMTRTVIA